VCALLACTAVATDDVPDGLAMHCTHTSTIIAPITERTIDSAVVNVATEVRPRAFTLILIRRLQLQIRLGLHQTACLTVSVNESGR
jgi:hypothetical protein